MPKVDPVAKQLFQWEQKQADGAMAKLQTLLLDAVAPLVHSGVGRKGIPLNTAHGRGREVNAFPAGKSVGTHVERMP